MKIALFQYRPTNNLEENYQSIIKALNKAIAWKARFFFTKECALSGYPPLEIQSVENLDFNIIRSKIEEVKVIAKTNDIHICLGKITCRETKIYNSYVIISPNTDVVAYYDKRALWGWDADNYQKGNENGIIEIDNMKIGIRICFEIRFPEYFKELYLHDVDIAFVGFCDIADTENGKRLETIKAHLLTRAIENSIYVVSVNSTSKYKTAPTAIIDPDGNIEIIDNSSEEKVIFHEINKKDMNFGRKGRISISNDLLGI